MYKEKAKEFVEEMIGAYSSSYHDDILEMYQLFLDNVEEGESAANEYSLLVEDIKELTELE